MTTGLRRSLDGSQDPGDRSGLRGNKGKQAYAEMQVVRQFFLGLPLHHSQIEYLAERLREFDGVSGVDWRERDLERVTGLTRAEYHALLTLIGTTIADQYCDPEAAPVRLIIQSSDDAQAEWSADDYPVSCRVYPSRTAENHKRPAESGPLVGEKREEKV